MTGTVQDLLEGRTGAKPLIAKSESDQQAAYERRMGGAAPVETGDEQESLEVEGDEQQDAGGDDAAPQLNEFGMTAEQMEALPEAARARLLGNEGKSKTDEDDGAQHGQPPDYADIEASLTEEFGKKSAKKLIETIVKPLMATQAASNQERISAVRERFSGAYPEIKKPEVLRAAVGLAAQLRKPGDDDATAFRRAVVTLYGDRRAQTRAQLNGQLSSPVKPGDKPKPITKDQAREAYFDTYQRTGSREKAQRAFNELNGRSR